MPQKLKSLMQTLVFAVLFLILFVILLPPLLRVLEEPWGKILYGALVAAAVVIAVRLRNLASVLDAASPEDGGAGGLGAGESRDAETLAQNPS